LFDQASAEKDKLLRRFNEQNIHPDVAAYACALAMVELVATNRSVETVYSAYQTIISDAQGVFEELVAYKIAEEEELARQV